MLIVHLVYSHTSESQKTYCQIVAITQSTCAHTCFVQDEADPARQSLRSSSRRSKSSSSHVTDTKPQPTQQRTDTKSPAESRYRYVGAEERERSFSKTQDWLNGNWPSREDIASATTSKQRSSQPRHDVSATGGQLDGTDDEKTDDDCYDDRRRPTVKKSARAQAEDDVMNVIDSGRGTSRFTAVSDSGRSRMYDDMDMPTSGSRAGGVSRPARDMRNDYSAKCQQLHSRYVDLKTLAEDAINTLITSASGPQTTSLSTQGGARYRQASPLRNNNNRYSADGGIGGDVGRTAPLVFGTPRRSEPRSRLSIEVQQHDSSHRSVTADGNVSALASTGRSVSATAEFLRYHHQQQAPAAGTDPASGHRGAEYWSKQVRQNADELSRPPPESVPVDDDRVETLREQLLRESDARIIARQTLNRYTSATHVRFTHSGALVYGCSCANL